MNPNLAYHLQQRLNVKTLKAISVSGGDINIANQIITEKGKFFLKSNSAYQFPRMFERESDGLKLLEAVPSIRIPKVYEYGDFEGISYLLLEWIDTKKGNSDRFWKNFGQGLAELHQTTRPKFGLSHANYIGSLDQYNNDQDNAVDFLIYERLEMQLMLAGNEKLIEYSDQQAFEKLYLKLPQIVPDEFPSLIHGDLWSGNWMCDLSNQAVLIDPSVSFGIREMDLAMMCLFGNPPEVFFEAYHHSFPLKNAWKERLDIYQLYYLLVHLNLFGNSYLGSIRQILNKYT